MYMPYARFNNPSTQIDASAKNPLGAIYCPAWGNTPAGAVFSPTEGSSTAGYGAPGVFKYVYYNSTSNPAPVAAPAPVYYTDESFTQISGNAAEAYFTTGGACVAGYLMPNTTAYSGLTAADLNQSYVWIQVAGFLSGAYAPTTLTGAGQGSVIYGSAAGNFASTVNTTLAASARTLGIQWTAVASGVCDVLVGGAQVFWGS